LGRPEQAARLSRAPDDCQRHQDDQHRFEDVRRFLLAAGPSALPRVAVACAAAWAATVPAAAIEGVGRYRRGLGRRVRRLLGSRRGRGRGPGRSPTSSPTSGPARGLARGCARPIVPALPALPAALGAPEAAQAREGVRRGAKKGVALPEAVRTAVRAMWHKHSGSDYSHLRQSSTSAAWRVGRALTADRHGVPITRESS